jgi:hypothetical protein
MTVSGLKAAACATSPSNSQEVNGVRPGTRERISEDGVVKTDEHDDLMGMLKKNFQV